MRMRPDRYSIGIFGALFLLTSLSEAQEEASEKEEKAAERPPEDSSPAPDSAQDADNEGEEIDGVAPDSPGEPGENSPGADADTSQEPAKTAPTDEAPSADATNADSDGEPPGTDSAPDAKPKPEDTEPDTPSPTASEKPENTGESKNVPTPEPGKPPGEKSSVPAAESDESLDDLDLLSLLEIDVSTATKTSESLEEAPAIITAITAQDIQRWGYENVGEVLRHVVGFYMIDDHIVPNMAVRGMSGGLGAESSVIKVMIDGRSVAFRTTSGNWLGTELIPLSMIKQVEIIRGPASALYGADAFLGVVNIITIKPEDVPTVGATVAGGVLGEEAFGRFDAISGTYGESFDFLLSAAGRSDQLRGLSLPEDSPSPRIPSYNLNETESQDLRRGSLVVGSRAGYTHPEKGHHLILSGYASGIRRGGDFAHWSQLSSGTDAQGREVGTVIELGQFRVNLSGLYQVTDELALASQAMYFQGAVLPRDRIEVASDLYYVERKMAYKGVDASLEGRWIPSRDLNVILGVESVYDDETLISSQRVSKDTDEVLGGDSSRGNEGLLNLGAFVSTNLQAIDRYLKLTGGARYDYHNLYGSQLSGRLGATSRITDSLVTKLLYGSAFKAPSPYLLFSEPLIPGDVIGNRDLEPQFIHTAEGQISFKPSRYFSATTGLSFSLLKNKAEFVPEGINLAAQNTASQNSLSWESTVDLRNGHAYGGYGSFEFIRGFRDLGREGYEADLVGTETVGTPRWIARAGAYVGVPSHARVPLELASQVIVAGSRRASDTSLIENGGELSFSPYALWNASLRTRDMMLFDRQKSAVALRVKNILGADGPDPGFSGFEYPLAPRELYLELSHQY